MPPTKPLTVARRDYIDNIVNLTNNSGLPAFIVVDVLEKVLQEVRPLMDTELERDIASYEAAKQQAEEAEQE